MEKITYVGHSQGTTQILSALSENANWFKQRINLFCLLAPVARVDRLDSKFLKGKADNTQMIKLLESIGPELLT